MIKKLNQFLKKELKEDEVYIFDVILCDNDIDRDGDCLSDNALDSLQKLFIDMTGLIEHNINKCGNRTARIFNTQVVLDDSKTTKYGTPYKYIKGNAYMVRTFSNEDLIKKIDGGIKKEVSISCTAKTHRCSICGAKQYECNHIQGEHYGGKLCYIILDDITDAYEWSIVLTTQIDKKSYIDYYTSKEITEISKKCKKSLLELYRFLRSIDESTFDEFDKRELHGDRRKILQMIDEINDSFGTEDWKRREKI